MQKKYTYLYFVVLVLSGSILLSSCWKLRGHYGGPKSFETVPRQTDPAAIALPAGYKIEAIAQGLTYPTALTFDETGAVYVTEAGYSYGEVWTKPRLLRIETDGRIKEIAVGEKNGPWSGLTYYRDAFYVAEGGTMKGGRILKISKEGRINRLAQNLPTIGGHFTTGPVIGPDGYLYFGQGTATNSGVVGPDNYKFGWLKRNPTFHDIPCQDIMLTGQNFVSENPLTEDKKDKATTGPFLPFNTAATANQVIKGQIPCLGAVLRMPLEGGNLELVAWGFRNPFGMAFDANNNLYITDNGYDSHTMKMPLPTAVPHINIARNKSNLV